MLYVWHISRDRYDLEKYSEAVVIASDEETARRIHPRGVIFITEEFLNNEDRNYRSSHLLDDWTSNISGLKVRRIGVADSDQEDREVICSSFHA